MNRYTLQVQLAFRSKAITGSGVLAIRLGGLRIISMSCGFCTFCLCVHNSVMQGQIRVMQLDLADLASIKKFAKTYMAEEHGPDLLMLNAGIMACPQSYTKDGFEMQIGKAHAAILHIALCAICSACAR